jgi:hypothetical protein
MVLLRLIARRLARGIDEPGWMHEKLVEVDALRREIEAQVGSLATEGPPEIRRAIDEAYARGVGGAQADLRSAGISGAWFRTPVQAVAALVAETTRAVQSTHFRILRATEDAYRQTVSDAVGQVVAGTLTRREAAQQTLDRLLGRGITGFVDSAGRGWDMASYVEMAVRTGSGHAAVQGAVDRFQADGRDLAIISNAPAECVKCRAWEGRTVSLTGQAPGYPTLADARSGGLFHPGCRHSLGAAIEGLTQPMTNTADPEGDAARQQQRYLERQIRAWKYRAALALDEQTRAQAAAKVRAWQARIREHVAANDLRRLPVREQITSAR